MATHTSSLYNELAIQPGDTASLNRLISSYPYFETPYVLKALQEKDDAAALHQAALVNNNPAWLYALQQPEALPEIKPEQPVNKEPEIIPEEHVQETIEEATPVQPEPATATGEPVSEIISPEITGAANTEQQPETSNQQPVTGNQQPAPPLASEALSFEPYHTVDYFASQGIKPAKDALPGDRFSHQLRSFTEWLKTMKKLSPVQMEEAPMKPAQQEEVVQLAETSLKKTEVLTETMAEVLVKQGRINEAVEILQKLSLLDKGKSAYFAARIQHLKSI